MPLHFKDLDVTDEVAGLSPALIVPCYMCPAVTVAAKENKPFIQFFSKFLKSAPFERYIGELQSRLREHGVSTKVFTSTLPHQWFLCMWTSGQREKLRQHSSQYKVAIVLGCETAAATVRDSVNSSNCKVIEGMQVTGFMNAKLRLHLPCNVSFDDCKIIPMSHGSQSAGSTESAGSDGCLGTSSIDCDSTS
jgi:hypothetical protein